MLNRIREAVLRRGEELYLHYQTDKYPYPPIFIVGFIRSGTTIVYQYLNARYKFAYFPNVARYQNYKHPILSTWLHKCHTAFTPKFDNEYGHIEGRCAPSDGWEIFHRWFSYYMHPCITKDLTELKKLITAFENLFGAPFLNKNNSNTLRVIELNRVFPDAVFIHVKRDIYSTIASVLKARQKHNVPKDRFWGVAPDINLLDLSFNSELELVVFQYLFCRKFIDKVCTIMKINLIEVDYEFFCENPQFLIKDLERMYPRDYLIDRTDFISEKISKKGTTQQVVEFDESIKRVQSQVELILTKTFDQLNRECLVK